MASSKVVRDHVYLVKDLTDWAESFNEYLDSRKVVGWVCYKCNLPWKEAIYVRKDYRFCPRCAPRKGYIVNPRLFDNIDVCISKRGSNVYICDPQESFLLEKLIKEWVEYSIHHKKKIDRYCNYPTCNTRACRGLPTKGYLYLYCAKHSLDGMYQRERGCILGCRKTPIYGNVFSSHNRCYEHREPGQSSLTYDLILIDSKGRNVHILDIIRKYTHKAHDTMKRK